MNENKNALQIIPLCGVEQIGANSTVLKYKESFVVVDAGLGFPGEEVYGVDYFIPNLDYLKANKEKIEGIVITHGHLDHIGALHHFLVALDFPEVYAPKFALELIKVKLKEKKLLEKAKLHEITDQSILKAKDFVIEFFRVNHSIPHSMGVIIKTPVGNIVHTGDFKFDNSPVNEPVADYSKLSKIGSEGVLALLSDSTNSFKEGHSTSEAQVAEILEEVCENAKGRIIVATFSSLVTRLYQLIELAQKTNRKVYISGRSMETAIRIAREIKFIDVNDDVFIKPNALKRYNDDRVMILSTGAQGETMASLSRMARGEHKDVRIKKGDTVILSASVVPGNDLQVQNMIDDLSILGARVFHRDVMDLHSSGHGFKEDQKLMINLVQPKFFMPIHGYQSFLFEHAETAKGLGIEPSHIIIPQNGEIIELTQHSWSKRGKVRSTPLLVSGLGVGDIGAQVLSDREQLANYGIVVISIVVDKNKQILRNPEVISRGFVYVKFNKELIDSIRQRVKDQYKQALQKTKINAEISNIISSSIRKYVYKETEREPMVLVNVMEI